MATPVLLAESIEIGALANPNIELLMIAVTLLACAGLGWLLYRTDAGPQMRAAVEDFKMARLLGVRADRVVTVSSYQRRAGRRGRRATGHADRPDLTDDGLTQYWSASSPS